MERSLVELDWPNPEESFGFAVLTLKNFDRSIQFYAESIYNRVQELEEDFQHFEVSDEVSHLKLFLIQHNNSINLFDFSCMLQ